MTRGWGKGLAAGCLALLVVVGAVWTGLRLPGSGFLDGFARQRGLDYSARPRGPFTPLSDAYLSRVLGSGASLSEGEILGPASRTGNQQPLVTSPASRVELDHAFTNDDFSRAIVAPSVPFTAKTDTRGASRQAGEPDGCGPQRGAGTVWYAYTPATDQTLLADTFGTSYADALAVYAGSALSDLRAVGCTSSLTGNAQVGFGARRGTTYYFQIGGTVSGGSLVFDLAPIRRTDRVSVSSTGGQGDGDVFEPPHVSADGRSVLFYSTATNLGGACAAAPCAGLFVRDRVTNRTDPVASISRTAPSTFGGGSYGDTNDLWPNGISADGRYVVFHTDSAAFGGDDHNGDYDVFLFDRERRSYERISVGPGGGDAHAPAVDQQRLPASPDESNFPGSKFASISGDGRYVTFTSNATDITADGGDGVNQVYVRDRRTGATERVSVGPPGTTLVRAETKFGPSISADGRFVAFMGWTRAPVTYAHPQGEETGQIYVRDRQLHRTVLASHNATGMPGNADSYWPAISADGSHVAFTSEATNLVPGDTNGTDCPRAGVDSCADFFAYQLATDRVTRVSVNSNGEQQEFVGQPASAGVTGSFQPIATISGDGRLIAFPSLATNLAPGDPNGKVQVFVHDLTTGATVRVSISPTGEQANDQSFSPALAADGNSVAFDSAATNLGTGDTNGRTDAFVHEL